MNVVGHLARTADYELAGRLVTRRRLELLLARTHSPWTLRADTSAVLEIIARQSPPDIPAEVRTALTMVNIRELAANVPGAILAALVAVGEKATAEAHAALEDDPVSRCRAFQAIAVELWRNGQADSCAQAVSRAVEAARAGEVSSRGECLENLVLALFEVGAAANALEVVQIWARERIWGFSLRKIAPALIEHNAAQLALTIAKNFLYKHDFWMELNYLNYEMAHALVAVALAEAGQVDQALELVSWIDDQRTGGWPHDEVTRLIARLATIAADHKRLEAARELAIKARRLLEAADHPLEIDRVSVAAAWARIGEPEQAVSLLAEVGLDIDSRWCSAGWPELDWWRPIRWDTLSERRVPGPRRDAAMIVAHQAILAGADDALLAATADTGLADVMRAAVAVAQVHAGRPDQARNLMSALTSDQGKAQVLLALADALAGSSPSEAIDVARQALRCTEAARAEGCRAAGQGRGRRGGGRDRASNSSRAFRPRQHVRAARRDPWPLWRPRRNRNRLGTAR